jgi:cellulose synthase/poly-beta-1,6-N-acetylglucosamine synthase-like glycosyltransferase
VGDNAFVDWFYGGFSVVLFIYLILIQGMYTVLTFLGWRAVNRYVALRPLRDYKYVGRSPLSLPVSILVPGYNEERGIVESIESLLSSQFNQLEVLVINDGSTDRTKERVIEAFDMVKVSRVPRSGLPTAQVRETWVSRRDERVILIDKENGGKADSLNAGINYASYPLICSIDADTILDQEALSRLVWEFQSSPDTVATGGIVRIINGSVMRDGLLVNVRTPPKMLANIQIVEYLRAFLGGRIGWSEIGALVIISGAFGLFRRDAVVAAGGYDATCVGEDAELVLRLYKTRADAGLPCRVSFFPDPICWTEAPSDLRTLARQRDRWQRGLGQMLWRHRAMTFNPKYGRVAMLGLPTFWLFELLGPIIEAVALVMIPLGFLAGYVTWPVFVLMFTLALLYGFFLSLVAILIEERAFRRYPSWTDLRRLTLAVLIENVGYRQWLAFVRARAVFRRPRGKHVWGEQNRMGFAVHSDEAEQADAKP